MREIVNIGVDLGGTTTKMALIDDSGKVLEKWAIPTSKVDNGSRIVADINASIQNKLKASHMTPESIRGIGIGAPGYIDVDSGFIYEAINIGWRNYPLKKEMEKQTGLPVVVENDANSAALGEMWRGSGRGTRNLICVTLGTGVGGGIISDGTVLHGVCGMAGEIGHMTVIEKGGAPCNCGKHGCLETVSSGSGIRRMGLEALDYNDSDSCLRALFEQKGDITAEDVFNCAAEGDALSAAVVDKAVRYLGYVLGAVSVAVGPEKIVIGGGVSHAGSQLMDPLNSYFKKYSLPIIYNHCSLVTASLGNDAGVIGAAWLVKTKLKQAHSV